MKIFSDTCYGCQLYCNDCKSLNGPNLGGCCGNWAPAKLYIRLLARIVEVTDHLLFLVILKDKSRHQNNK